MGKMAIEYAIIIGYGIVSLILMFAATTFETQNKQFLPLRLLLLLVGIFIMLKIPGTLNHMVYANDVANQGVLNATQVTNLIRSNETVSRIIIRLPYIIGAYLFVWYFFIRFVKDSGEAYQEQANKWPKTGMKKW